MQLEFEKLQDNSTTQCTSTTLTLRSGATIIPLVDEQPENNDSDQNNLKIILNPRWTDSFRCSS